MKKRKPPHNIRGSGGGGGDPPPPPPPSLPYEAPDSLRSRAFLRVVDLISEGEIVGLVDGRKSIFLDETPLQSSNGVDNFSGVTYEHREGTQSQTYMKGFSSVESETSINVEMLADTPVVRQITDEEVDRVRVRLMIPQLSYTASNGDVLGTSIDVAIDVQPDGGSYTEVATRSINGKSTSRYEFTMSIPLTGSAPWNVRMRRVGADATTTNRNKTYAMAITEVIDSKLRYPNSALVAMRIDSQQFQSAPQRFYEIDGLIIQIPSNYDPETREYTGVWDGTFTTGFSNNPAWVFWDLATNSRYGLGAFLPAAQVDKWSLYQIGRYCDELVPDGFGDMEPRFTCNLCIADATEAYTVMQNLASVFRGMVYWAAGAVTVAQDSPQDAAALYTPANVIDGVFTYQGASAKAKHNVALVSWNDPDDFYRQKVEYVEDQDSIALRGVQKTDVVAFGCTSRGQAHRFGKWLLYTEQHESETVSFKTGLDGIVGRPGQVIKVADPARAGARMGGRISSATTTTVTVDDDIVGAISGHTLAVMLPDGTVEERTVVGSSGRVITVQPALSLAPAMQAIWVLQSDVIEAQTFRVIGIKEDEAGQFTITALSHDPDKFAAVELGLVLEPRSISALRTTPDAPQNVTITESLYQSAAEVKAKVTVSWDRVDNASAYIVRWKRDNENFITLPETQFNEADILDAQPGTYTIVVSAISALGKRSVPTQATAEVFGKTAPPADVVAFSMIPNQGHAYLTWTRATDLDVLVGGQVRIRHTPRITGQSWSDAVDIIPAVAGTATTAVAPLITGTYLAKFMDSSGIYSTNAVEIITTVPYALALNVVDTQTEHPTFTGVKTNMIVDTVNNALALASNMLVDDYPLIDDVINWDLPGDIASSGTYEFANTVDLGGVLASKISRTIDLEALDLGTLIDSRTDLIDDWSDIDGNGLSDVNAILEVRTTEDNPSASPSWTVWKPLHAGEYTFRGMQMRLQCTSGNPDHSLLIKELEVVIDMPDRTLAPGNSITSGAGTYSVTYAEPFYAAPSVSITANAMATGDYFTITNQTANGFDIVFKNSGGTAVSRVFNYIAKGYGRKVA